MKGSLTDMRNNLKKAISSLLAIVIMLSLTACGETKDEIKAGRYKIDADEFAYNYCLIWESYEKSAFYAEVNYGSGNGMAQYGYDCTLLPHEQVYYEKYSQVTDVTLEDLGVVNPTWEDVIVYIALNNIIGMEYVFEEAEKRGITPENTRDAEIEENVAAIKAEAEKYGLSFEECLLARYGAALTEEEYRAIYEESNLFDDAVVKLKEAYKREVTEEDYQAEYESDKEEYDKLGDSIIGDVRHILIEFPRDSKTDKALPITDSEKAGYLKKAQDILEIYKKNPTEDNFIKLVKEYSNDSASVENGGLYTNVIKDETYVAEFEKWAVDPSRQVGDVEIIETIYGYHVMYFVKSYGNAKDFYVTKAAASYKYNKDYRAAMRERLAEIDFRSKDITAITEEQKGLLRALINTQYRIVEE